MSSRPTDARSDVPPVARALLDEFGPDELRDLAQRLAPFLPEPEHNGVPGDWLTLRQAAAYLAIGYSTAKRYAAEGTWPVKREGRRCYVRRADLDRWRTR